MMDHQFNSINVPDLHAVPADTRRSSSTPRVDAQTIAQALTGGKKKGAGWVACCPAHDDKSPSLSITDGDSGPVWNCLTGCTKTQVTAALRARGIWGQWQDKPIRTQARHTSPTPAPTAKPAPTSDWAPMVPPPAGTPEPDASAQRGFSRVHEYRGQGGDLLFLIRRQEARAGRNKQFIPWTYGTLTDATTGEVKTGWHPRHADAPRPLYHLDALAARPDATVLLCEGEKAAEAAQALFPDHVAMTWPGGSSAVAQADWTPLRSRTVIIWPDNDNAGHKAATQVQNILPHASIIRVDDMPDGHDAADVTLEDPDAWLADRAQAPAPRPAPILQLVEDIGKKAKPPANTADLDGFALHEDGIALAFAEKHKGALRYDHDRGKWFRWTGKYWARDETKIAFSWSRDICRQLAKEGGAEDKFAALLAKASTAASVERYAQADEALAVTSSVWDCDPWLLGTPDGTIDLRTGAVLLPKASDHITKHAAVVPAASPDCPLWLQFLHDATNGDDGLIRFLRQWCGYTLTGVTIQHALLFIYGPGGNGKSVFLNTVFGLLGTYAQMASMETFTSGAGDKHPTDMAMLAGARMVCASETEEGRAWAETRIKQLTGGDPVSARFMRQDFFTFLPAFKLAVIGNHLPVLRNVDDAARRRFNVVPFVHKPPNPDRTLEAKLKAEGPAILRWMIEGCLDWQKNGLVRPRVVTEATGSYFSEQDSVRQWIEDHCETGKRSLSDTSDALFKSWTAYAVASGEKAGTMRWFSQNLARQGFEPVADTPGHRKKRGFIGIQVKHTDTSSQWQNRHD